MASKLEQIIAEGMVKYPGRLYQVCDWKELFAPEVLDEMLKSRELQHQQPGRQYYYYWSARRASFKVGKQTFEVDIRSQPERYGTSWKNVTMTCTCRKAYCVHMAATLQLWEKEHGPWVTWESETDYRVRMENEKLDRLRSAREKQDEGYGLTPVPARQAFQGRSLREPIYLDLEAALEGFTTTPAAIHRMDEAKKEMGTAYPKMQTYVWRDGSRQVDFSAQYSNSLYFEEVWGWLNEGEFG